MNKLLGISLLLVLVSVGTTFGQGGANSPQNKNTDNGADQNLRSSARINPSTLAMEMSLPLATYPGRNGNSLPIGISYSSKLWRMKDSGTYFYTLSSGLRQYVTWLHPQFAERSAAGWTSSVNFPVIEEKLELFTQDGDPFSFDTDYSSFNSQLLDLFQEQTQNTLPPPPTSCGWNCNFEYDIHSETWVCYPWRIFYTNWGCDTGGGGGGCGTWCGIEPTGTGVNPPPPKMNYVKRVHVRMGDGSTVEFRKSDAAFGYCVGGSADGLNCEGSSGFMDNIGTFLSVDGSGMKLERTAAGSTLFLPNGGRYLFPSTSSGTFNEASLYQSTDFIDFDGNRSRFVNDTTNNIRTLTDTLGRSVNDLLPQNFNVQEQTEGVKEVTLPGLDGQQTQLYKFKWLHLKPVAGGLQEGALQNQSENIFRYGSAICIVAPETYLYPTDLGTTIPPDIMFPSGGVGLRSCNPGTTVANAERFNPVVLAEVTLPNGKTYEFKYNQFGEITKITYPSGSFETFTYSQILPLNASGAAFDQTNRGVTERRVYDADGTPQQRWKYSAGLSTPNNRYKVTTIAPKGNDPWAEGLKTEKFLHTTDANTSKFGFENQMNGMAYEEGSYDESGVLRSRSLSEFTVNGPVPTNDPLRPANGTAQRDPRRTRMISIAIENGQALATMSESEYETPGENGSTAPLNTDYFAHLNLKRAKSHHFRNIPTSLAQTGTLAQIAAYFNSTTLATIGETDYTYNADYKARGISSLVAESRVLDKDGNLVSKTQSVFDESAYLVADSGTLSGNLVNTWTNPVTDTTFPSNFPAAARLLRGKPTTSKVWNSDSNTWIQSHVQYDQYGNTRKAWEVNEDSASSRFTETQYSSDYGFAYPTKVLTPAPDPTNTHGISQGSFATTTYDFTTGLPLTVSNEFGQTTKTEYNDSLLRPTKVYGLGDFVIPIAETVYDDDLKTVKVRKQIDSTNWDEATTYMDTLGRTVKTVAKDSQGDVIVETKYDLLGRVQMVSNPYRQGDAVPWSLTEYDAAGRAKQSREPVVNQSPASPTGNILGTTTYDISTAPGYIGTVVMTTDAALKKSRSITNALGQLIVVEEPDHTGNLPALPQSTPVPSPSPNPSPTPHGQCISPVCPENFSGSEYPSYATFYDYNAQGKMVKVTQGFQFRYFKYDSLGRLIRVRQPEQEVNTSLNLADAHNTSGQWTAGFAYDTLGNVVRATDANGVNIINEYDKAGRVVKRCYTKPNISTTASTCAPIIGSSSESTDTPAVSYFYDGIDHVPQQTPYNFAKGKLTKVTSSVSETRNELFDNFGRVTQSSQTTDGNTYTSRYTYNFAGALVEEEYPSGRKVKNEFEADGDLASVTSRKTANGFYTPYVSNFSYTASGGISQMKLGNGRWETAKFNTRMQVTELGLGTNVADANLWKTNYEYGELDSNGNTDPAKNTGNIAKQILTVPGTSFVQAYKYDSLYRITEAKETTGTTQNWIQNWGYDRYGNRTGFSQNIAGNTSATYPAIDQNTNRFSNLTDFAYDKNGNITRDLSPSSQLRTFVFNGDNKQTQVKDASGATVGQYYYDGEGKRVKKFIQSTGETTIFVYSSGKLVAEYSTVVAPTSVAKVAYTTTDHLGSPRVITDAIGQVVSRRDFMPFGEDLNVGVGNRTGDTGLKYSMPGDNLRQKFTGYQKDNETQLDFAEARMYENRFGRFTAVDPLLASGRSANPQTFNRYGYTSNNPIVRIDENGKDWYYAWKRHDKTGRFYATPTWCSGFGCRGHKWGTEVRSTVGGVTTIWKTGLVFRNDISGGYTALDPYEDRKIGTFNSAASAQVQVTQWRKQGILNFIGGVLNGASLAVSISGADGLVAETGSEMYAMGQRAGVGGSIASVVTGVGLTNAVLNQFGKAGLKVLRGIEFSAKGGEGVYDLGTTLGKYVGQSQGIMARVKSHFAKGGKLSGGELETTIFHAMPGSTKLEREAYEQFIINKHGIDNLVNIRNPMGGRPELYKSMIDDVITKFNLPR